jgi:outer membrane protein OmpU
MNWKPEGKTMKKVLFATTALVATAGVAAAELSLSGSARFGVKYNDTATSPVNKLNITNRFTLNIDGSASTDTGLDFFARVRIRGGNTGRDVGSTADPTGSTSLGSSGVSAPRVGVSYNNFTLATGNILGAYESAPGLYDGSVGLTGLGWHNLPGNVVGNRSKWDDFSSAGAGSNGLEVIYSNAGFGAHISWSDTAGFPGGVRGTTSGERIAANVSYTFGDWTAAAAYQDASADVNDKWLITFGGNIGDFGVGAAYGDNNDITKWRINGSYTFGAGTTVTAYVADEGGAASTATDTGWGLGFTHSLGGATLAGGVVGGPSGETLADLGVRFSF